MAAALIIPNSYVIRRSRDEPAGARTLTVRKYITSAELGRQEILEGLAKSRLVFGNDFGVIQIRDENDPERNIRALCGLVGDRNLVLLDEHTNQLNYLCIRHVLLATLMIEFVSASQSSRLDFLVYGGKQGLVELWSMLKANLGVNDEPVPVAFTDIGVRNLCERFFDRLYQITFDPLYQSGWGTISAADFRSRRGQYINPEVDRMRQIRESENIIIRTFESEIRNQTIAPLEDYYDIRFRLLKDSGVNMKISELKVPSTANDLDYETVLYGLAQQTYNRIIGYEDIYEAIPEKPIVEQLKLF